MSEDYLYLPIDLLDSRYVVTADGTVSLYGLLQSQNIIKNTSEFDVPLGMDMLGKPVFRDLSKISNILIVDSFDSDGINLLNVWLTHLLFRSSPFNIRLLIVGRDFFNFDGIPHLLTPVLKEPDKVLSALKWLLSEIDRRQKFLATENVRSSEEYNKKAGFQSLPDILFILDDIDDLLSYAPVEFEDAIDRILSKGKQFGIHTIIHLHASKNNNFVFNYNYPTRIIFKCSLLSKLNLISDPADAEKLFFGDMLYKDNSLASAICISGLSVSKDEIANVVKYLKQYPQIVPDDYDENYPKTDNTSTTPNPYNKKLVTGEVGKSEDETTDLINLNLDDFIKKNQSIINKFCEIGERNFSTIDEYGDLDYNALSTEKRRCIKKIAVNLGLSEKYLNQLFEDLDQYDIRGYSKEILISKLGQSLRFALGQISPNLKTNSYYLLKLYFYDLENIFKDYHEKYKLPPDKNDYNSMSGRDFENYITIKLSEGGFEVVGTKKTGDQGADIIAKKDNKQ